MSKGLHHIAEPSRARIEHFGADASFSIPLTVPWYYAPHLAVLAIIVGLWIYDALRRAWGWL